MILFLETNTHTRVKSPNVRKLLNFPTTSQIGDLKKKLNCTHKKNLKKKKFFVDYGCWQIGVYCEFLLSP